MGWGFNPFTVNFDRTGGGGASYIDGVLDTANDLPVTVGTPALDAVYLVKEGSGVWLVNRKPAGLYCRTANNGNINDWTYLGAFPEVNSDANWRLYNDTNPTRELQIELTDNSTITFKMTGTDSVVRTLTFGVE